MSTYIINPFLKEVPEYMKHETWAVGKFIEEIHVSQHPSSTENEGIEKETKKISKSINYMTMSEEELQRNEISKCVQR